MYIDRAQVMNFSIGSTVTQKYTEKYNHMITHYTWYFNTLFLSHVAFWNKYLYLIKNNSYQSFCRYEQYYTNEKGCS